MPETNRAAMSSGRPIRRSGHARIAKLVEVGHGLSTFRVNRTGSTEFTRIPLGPSSAARVLVSELTCLGGAVNRCRRHGPE